MHRCDTNAPFRHSRVEVPSHDSLLGNGPLRACFHAVPLPQQAWTNKVDSKLDKTRHQPRGLLVELRPIIQLT
jgi:hypothetical protein